MQCTTCEERKKFISELGFNDDYACIEIKRNKCIEKLSIENLYICYLCEYLKLQLEFAKRKHLGTFYKPTTCNCEEYHGIHPVHATPVNKP